MGMIVPGILRMRSKVGVWNARQRMRCRNHILQISDDSTKASPCASEAPHVALVHIPDKNPEEPQRLLAEGKLDTVPYLTNPFAGLELVLVLTISRGIGDA